MAIKVNISDGKFIFAPEINELTSRWGLYAIPRMWREPNGELIVRFNGEEDCSDTNMMFAAPNLYFQSQNNGETWGRIEDGDKRYNVKKFHGITSPYLKLKSGFFLAIEEKENIEPIQGLIPKKTFEIPGLSVNEELKIPAPDVRVSAYQYSDIPDECKGIELLKYNSVGKLVERSPIVFDFPEREVLVNAEAYANGEFIRVEQYIKPFIFKNPYFSSMTELPDGTIVALSYGQHPEVDDRYCPVVYLVESKDEGKTWRKRGVIASDKDTLPFGYSGDGNEMSLTRTTDGTLLCAMRMEMSLNPDVARPICDTMLAASYDGGYTWEKTVSVADSSVTPQILALDNHVVILVYGRPGVHFKVSEDDGRTWSEPYPIIGKTLTEERKTGRKDSDIKYYATCSYSNTFVEKIDGNSVLVLYNDLKYAEDETRHKAAYVKKITIDKK